MPVCPQCDNRVFSTKEALLQHMKSSSAWHPFCVICDRRFVSNAAYDAHMVAKHPVTYDCTICSRSYHAQFALEDHYRGSSAHPNCPVCGKGFRDNIESEEHHRTSHPRVPCTPCGGKIFYEEALDSHYANSTNHPKCKSCLKGFKDEMLYAEHLLHSHPELRCEVCTRQFDSDEGLAEHYLSSLNHPKCKLCGIGLKDEEALSMHNQETHPQYAAQEQVVELYSTGFTPLNPINPAKLLIAGERPGRSNSPALSLNTNFMSPIKDVPPLFSPIGLPQPGKAADEKWESFGENVQRPAPVPQPAAPERPSLQINPKSSPPKNSNGVKTRPRSESDVLIEEAFTPILEQLPDNPFPPAPAPAPIPGPSWSSARTFSPPSRFTTSLSPLQRDTVPLRGGASFNARPAPQQPRFFSPPQFNGSRLYPGSVRAAAAARAGQSSSSYQGPYMQGTSYRSQSTHSLASLSSLGSRDSDDSSLMRTRPPPPISDSHVDWHGLFGNGGYSGRTSHGGNSVISEAPTPKMETPLRHTISLVNHGSLPSPSATRSTSPSSAADYSPPSAFGQPDTRPTTASSSQAPLLITYPVTASSDCSRSPVSPEVDSPDGLAVLPHISPLASTPVDLTYDIPEARHPLPDSPIASAVVSPQTVILEVDTCSTPSADQRSKDSSAGSVVTQIYQPASNSELRADTDNSDGCQPDGKLLLPSPIPTPARSPLLSPVSAMREDSFTSANPSPIPEWALDPEPSEHSPIRLGAELPPLTFNNEVSVAKVADCGANGTETYESKTPLLEPEETTMEVISVPATSEGVLEPGSKSTSILHCRICKKDTCDDITATMCGHIFCYKCITEQIIKSPRCPVCATPTLLYCLFKLDLKA